MSAVTASWIGLGLALGLGAGIALSPAWTSLVVSTLALILALLVLTWSTALWRWCCLALLVGYVVLGRGFAYTSLPLQWLLPDTYTHIPVYVGELVLGLCLLTVPHAVTWPKFEATAPVRWLIPWLVLGAVLTIPNLPVHGLNALRDAATWYYAAFLYVGFTFASRQSELFRLFRVLVVALMLHLLYSLAYLVRLVDFEALAIRAPGSDFPLFTYRHDVSAVVFLGGTLFVLLLGRHYRWRSATQWLLALPQFGLFIALEKRAVYVAFCLATGVLLYLRRLGPVLLIAAMAALIFAAAVGWGWEVDLVAFDTSFKASPGRVAEFVTTMFDAGGRGRYRYGESELSLGSAEWRREYWQQVIFESTEDPMRFLIGRGFGPDLMTSKKYTFGIDRPNRNPHNIAVTVFARMGLVGLLLWVAFHVSIFRRFLAGIQRAVRVGQAWDRDVITFVLVYAVSVLGASLFSVMLEAPFVAIPYYFLMGCALRVAMEQPERQLTEGGRAAR